MVQNKISPSKNLAHFSYNIVVNSFPKYWIHIPNTFGTTFNVFGYGVVWAKNRINHLTNTEQLLVTPQMQVLGS